MLMKFYRSVAVVIVVLALGGCSIYSLPGEQPAPVETRTGEPTSQPTPPGQPPTPVHPQSVEREPVPTSAYESLVARANEASARGDYEQALATLERAQRIAPDRVRPMKPCTLERDPPGCPLCR